MKEVCAGARETPLLAIYLVDLSAFVPCHHGNGIRKGLLWIDGKRMKSISECFTVCVIAGK